MPVAFSLTVVFNLNFPDGRVAGMTTLRFDNVADEAVARLHSGNTLPDGVTASTKMSYLAFSDDSDKLLSVPGKVILRGTVVLADADAVSECAVVTFASL